jgi:isoquinoline 1-oxidoreductase beta subunit
MMLVQAAADEWKVPAAECRAGQHRHAHAERAHRHYGKVAQAAASSRRRPTWR